MTEEWRSVVWMDVEGSIVGPLLFVIFIIDLPNVVHERLN